MPERLKLEEGWTTLFLVWSMIAVTGFAIMATEVTDQGLQVLLPVGTLAVLAGLLLAKSNFPARRAHLYALVYGLAVVAFTVGRTLPGDLPWRLRILDLWQRQIVWMGKAINGGISRDSLIFVLQTAAVFWLLGYTASWYTFRKPRVWRAVLPTGLVLLSVIYYYYGPKPLAIYMGVYALLALLYVARTHLVDREKSWRSGSVFYDRDDILLDFMRASLLVGTVVLLLAGSLPAMGASTEVNEALSGVDRPWRSFQDSWTRLFSSLRTYGTGTNDTYSDTMVLGGPRSVGNGLIMDVRTSRPLSSVYWQGVIYDTYNGRGGWSNNSDETVMHFPDEGTLDVPFSAARDVITQTVVNYIPNSSTLYGAPEVVGSNRQMVLDVDEIDANGAPPQINWLRSRYVLRQGDSYSVISRVSMADMESLRTAPTDYPGWVLDRYLQLPDTITEETKRLAAELTTPHDNVFDKTIAVRNFLREEIAYNDQIAAPPDDVEPVHYTIFVSQEAYCTYYASSMAVMLRSQGIPARIVNGYARGEYIEEANVYRVRASNAHTWVEVYFPGYGWIQFEPTAAIPVVDRPEQAPSGNPGDPFDLDPNTPELEDLLTEEDRLLMAEEAMGQFPGADGVGGQPESAEQQQRAIIVRALGGGVLLAVAGGLVFIANQFNRKIESDVERSYGRLSSWARWLGVFFRPADTPYERADRLSQAVPEGRGPIRNLTHHYVLRRFSANGDREEAFDPRSEWRVLRPLLLRESLLTRWRRFRKRR